ncbi:MAG: 23S rRNA (uridine(2552)-2'-O)-methyltransferase RlmE [Gammaproteobacteria bacterium]|uniref:23S rRNA (uridine(2552)-2'-O)-methyltransferase RlmE n=1 Tax=Marinomonas TaxID=28253 RepID=UPI000C1EB437|nr:MULTISPECIES: 23S rRNA (uridine(2552)-2'-O)-methyltransferase RlmE [unclassified Marinomonas]MBU1293821.1 23S rRNA (uridine(2552)-2'-O)-methyltransferase RlmE [Gammaproteobacteria bacterium]MBU1466589.1 23S rRNA (uridine(2552)-2'-O)-methyltransferase RlmE [Gammaproteobacteria bacterium]MBU2023846.1 23S rRNA (uridine(2552)-2'-O)-methyltransferase RlmE [Gammaproteobacteria bacterium]MBU2238828.1 23S rRNA (uridine(2552)-2'-O)-methyltransferase RlmE [Gammaproteobacteria bacterium]MBU2317886.1 2
MARSKSSNNWMKEHFDDPYVKKSQQDGYRSRASYKLIEINDKDKLFKPAMRVVDLGAAPGGWSQVAAKLVGDHGTIVASDILEMAPLPGVSFVQGDFTEQEVYEAILAEIGDKKADLVISDMAPNMSGNSSSDQPQAMYLVELALDMAAQVLRPGGNFLVKVFQGEGFEEYLKTMRVQFESVVTRKPDASRARSREVYLLGRQYKG